MQEPIIFEVTKGQLVGAVFAFDYKTSFYIGRQNDCVIALPEVKASRHHCEIDIDPPSVRVRDMSSLNGTYLNGALIGKREKHDNTLPPTGKQRGFVDMKDGDLLGISRDCELTLHMPAQQSRGHREIAGYEPVELLARGGMGDVWRVRKKYTNDEFALKLISMRGAPHEKDKRHFVREMTLTGQLKHPHIVTQRDCGELGDTYYIVQELCTGGNVNDLLKCSDGLLTIETATHIILQVLEALKFAHKKGIVHRDIHPGNILLMDRSDTPTAKIGDFGLSKLFEATGCTNAGNLVALTGTGDFAGTPDFTPRTQIKHYKEAQAEVDVWAAAATYYYMLTGLPPKDLSYAEKWQLALIENAIPIRRRNPTIPKELAMVIDTALVEDPGIGCKHAQELIAGIKEALREGGL